MLIFPSPFHLPQTLSPFFICPSFPLFICPLWAHAVFRGVLRPSAAACYHQSHNKEQELDKLPFNAMVSELTKKVLQ